MKDIEKILEVCRNLKGTLDKEIRETCTQYSNPMFNKPIVKRSVLKRKLDKLLKKYNINKEDL